MREEPVNYIENDRFIEARKMIIGKAHNDKGIGTLSEKAVHGVMKNFYEPRADYQEVALKGYFADIYNETGVIEIQTKSFDRLREKLAVFLNEYPVTIVYPMSYNKWIIWIDKQTGEVLEKRKSPRHCTVYDAFIELYRIKDYLKMSGLRLDLVQLDVEEYRMIDTKKLRSARQRRGVKLDRIPMGIREIITIEQPEDYMQFVPYELEGEFTSEEFARVGKMSVATARVALNILNYMGTVKRVGKKGRSYLYEINETIE